MNDSHETSAEDASSEPDLVALLGSRLCHDIASPLGAVSNGLELLELSVEAPTDEMRLMRSSLDAVVNRLRFFRLAFGMGDAGTLVPAREAAAVVTSMYAQDRREVVWQDAKDRPRGDVRLAYLSLACIEYVTPFGARIEVDRSPSAWTIRATAKRFREEPRLWSAVAANTIPPDLKGAEVQFGLLVRGARMVGRDVTVDVAPERIEISV